MLLHVENGDKTYPHDQAATERIVFEVFGPDTPQDEDAVQC